MSAYTGDGLAQLASLCVCRGKLLNVRDASAAQIAANAEIQAIKQIMGLQHGKVSLLYSPREVCSLLSKAKQFIG